MFDLDILKNTFHSNGSLFDINNKSHLKRYGFQLLIIFVLFLGLVSCPMYIYHHIDNFSDVAQAMSNIVNLTLILAYFLVIYLQNDGVNNLLTDLNEIDEFSRPQEEVATKIYDEGQIICINCSKFSKLCTYLVAVAGGISAIDIFIQKDFESRVKLWFPFDTQTSATGGPVLLVFLIATISITSHMASVATMINCLLVQVVVQLKILNLKFRSIRSQAEQGCPQSGTGKRDGLSAGGNNLFDDQGCKVETVLLENKDSMMDASKESLARPRKDIDKTMHLLLGDCVAHHCALLKFIDDLETLLNPLLTVHLGVCLMESVLILVSSAMSTTASSTTTTLLLIISLGIYIVLNGFCYISQLVSDETERLKEAVYSCDWTDADQSFKKSIGIIISMTNQPAEIKAAGFVPLSMQTLTNVLNAAYSYYMVLSNFQ